MYSDEERTAIQTEICEKIAVGRSLVSILEEMHSRPNGRRLNYSTVTRWLVDDEAFRTKYTRAREDQADYLAEEVLEIADAAVVAPPEGTDPIVRAEVTRFDMERRKQRIDARKWRAAHLKPKVYGARSIVQGDDEAPPVRTSSTIDERDKRDLARWIAATLTQGANAANKDADAD